MGILARLRLAKIRTMARPNSPDMPPKRTKKVRLGIFSTRTRALRCIPCIVCMPITSILEKDGKHYSLLGHLARRFKVQVQVQVKKGRALFVQGPDVVAKNINLSIVFCLDCSLFKRVL